MRGGGVCVLEEACLEISCGPPFEVERGGRVLSGLLSSAPPERKGEELGQEARIECVRLMGRKKGRGKGEGRLAIWS